MTRRSQRANGVLAVLLVCLACVPVRSAHASCDSRDRYQYSVNVGFVLGMTFAPHLRFLYGIDVRGGRGPAVGFGRIEGHGLTNARLAIGLQLVTKGVAGEVGLAGLGAHRHEAFDADEIGSSLGVHLGIAAWDPTVSAAAMGTIPLLGDMRNYDVSAAGFLVLPGDICPPG